MSKKFKNKICVYCTENMSSTGDHVFAREFFLPDERDNLPKVPSCDRCNNEKSELEHYLTAILPFGGRHTSASENLSTMVPKRLKRNKKLHSNLAQNMSYALSDELEGTNTKCMILPIEGEKFLELFALITKGLVWHHWGTLLTKDFSVATAALTKYGEDFFSNNFMLLNSAKRVENKIGSNVFSYSGLQGVDVPQISVWQFTTYSGIKFTESNENHSESSTIVGAVSGPNKLVARYKEMFNAAT